MLLWNCRKFITGVGARVWARVVGGLGDQLSCGLNIGLYGASVLPVTRSLVSSIWFVNYDCAFTGPLVVWAISRAIAFLERRVVPLLLVNESWRVVFGVQGRGVGLILVVPPVQQPGAM